MKLFACFIGVVLAAGPAYAQTLYRWTDEHGKVHITDTPPPGAAKGVVTSRPPASPPASAPAEAPLSFELAIAMKDFPVVLYTAPGCKEVCSQARVALNKRGVPFKEVQVWDESSNEELKNVSGGNDVPTLLVGRSMHRGFEQGAYDALLDSARYPRAGLLPARTQAAPAAPEGYVSPESREALKAAPSKPAAAEEPAQAAGPYSPKPPAKPESPIARPYAPIPGKDAPRTGPYAPKPPAESAQKQ